MGDYAIRVEGLGKRYRIGERQQYKALRDVLTDALTAPVRAVGARLRGEGGSRDGKGSKPHIWALKEVSFEVEHGEVLGIIGRNGAGKSTLLKILSRITEPTEGEVRLRGRVGSLLEVGTGFHPELTGRENIILNGAILGMARAEIGRKFDEIVAFAEVEKFVDTPVKHYSSGMAVRLGFAVAAHLEPQILLVDEVLAVGDAAFQKKCLGKMETVAREGRTVLFVSHNMVAVQSLCRTGLWIDDGRIVELGPTGDVVAGYLSRAAEGAQHMERVWDEMATAPGTDQVRIRRVFVRPVSNAGLRVDQALEIGVELWSLLPDQDLTITLHILTFERVVAFSTSTAHNTALLGRRLEAGLHRARCHVPANLLNAGTHHVRLLVVKNQARVVFRLDEALTFEVLDAAGQRGAYYGKRPGVVAPHLVWDMQQLGDDGVHKSVETG